MHTFIVRSKKKAWVEAVTLQRDSDCGVADICAAVMRLGQQRLCHFGPAMSACVRKRGRGKEREREDEIG